VAHHDPAAIAAANAATSQGNGRSAKPFEMSPGCLPDIKASAARITRTDHRVIDRNAKAPTATPKPSA